MTALAERIVQLSAGLAMASVLLAPFAFGTSTLGVWVPLSLLWICLGLVTTAARAWFPSIAQDGFEPAPKVMVALHALFAIQSVALPAFVLRALSPGSFAAHFLPAGEAMLAPLTASPTGTAQAWLFVGALHGLAVAIFGAPRPVQMRRLNLLFAGMAGVSGILAIEGLVQSASAHPHRLYGIYEVPGAADHERGIFGPYYNRDHYSNLMAMGGAVAAALLGRAVRAGSFGSLAGFAGSPQFGVNLALLGALCLTTVASAAAGSRGGLAALGVGLLVGLGPELAARPRLALVSLGVGLVILFGASIPTAFLRMADVDFEASRLMVWRDMLRVVSFFPIFGCGLGAFAVAYWPYQRVVRFEYWPHAHNEYLQWILETGAAGLVLALYVLRRAWIAAPEIARSLDTRPALAGLAAMLTHALVDLVLRVPANAAWAALLLVGVTLATNPSARSVRGAPWNTTV